MAVNDDQVVFERKIMTGGESLTKSIVDYCKLDVENAEKLKREYGITTGVMSDKIIEATHIQTSSLEKLVSDIQYSIKYFTFQVTRSKINKFEKVLLVGGMANLLGIREFIAERLAMDCVVADFSEQVTIPKGMTLEEGDEKPWPAMGSVLGLGFWQVKEWNNYCTNLLPEAARPKTLQEVTTNQIKKGVGSIAVLSLVIIGDDNYWFRQHEGTR